MKINHNYLFLLIALSILLGVVADFLVEILAPGLDKLLMKEYGENYQDRLWWLLIVVIVGLALLAFWQSRTKPSESVESVSTPPDESINTEIRKYLKSRYEHRISQKLAGREPVNLRKIPSSTGTSDEGAQNFITLPAEKVPSGMAELFDEARGRLLVVGAPGAGKTTLLLQLALELLKRADAVPAALDAEPSATKVAGTVPAPISVLLNLATWRSEFATFDDWLQRILPLELGASKALAEKIRRNTPLILLLDGLDEVPEADRASCLKAVGEYGAETRHRFVISSRIAEYATTQDAPVYLEVEVQPLTPQQVIDNLTAYVFHQPEAKPLLNALQTDPLLREAIANPFYLNTAQLLFATGRKYSDFDFKTTDVAGRQQELVERFVEDALGRKVKRDYPKEKARKWLKGLIQSISDVELGVFELTNIQSDKSKTYYLILYLVSGLSFGAAIGFGYGVFFANNPFSVILYLFKGCGIGIIIGFEMWLLELLISWIIPRYYTDPGSVFYWFKTDIDTVDIRIWSWKKFFSSMLMSSIIIIGLAVIMFITTFILNSFNIASLNFKIGLVAFSAFWVIVFIGGGLISGEWYYNESFLKILNPYQRFKASIKNFNPSIFKHLAIRLTFWSQDSIPLRLVTFLNEMSLRHLLEFDGDPTTGKGGGSWRWRHRIIQEYFLRDEL